MARFSPGRFVDLVLFLTGKFAKSPHKFYKDMLFHLFTHHILDRILTQGICIHIKGA
jgi:hypothetical protein